MIKEEQADALIISNQVSCRFLANFPSEEAEFILTANGDRALLSDSCFKGQIRHQAPGEMKVVMQTMNVVKETTKRLKQLDVKNILVEGEFISATQLEALKEACPDLNFVLGAELVEKICNIRDDSELATLRKVIDISAQSFKEILPLIKPGVSEGTIGARLDYLFKMNGGDDPSFKITATSGHRGSWTHGVASNKKIQQGELTVVDLDSFYHGYTADITRTVALGQAEPELEKIYYIVLEAQKRGTAGNTGKDIDQAVRNYTKEQGYGECFGHGIGYGIGLEVRESYMPAISYGKEVAKNNMAITVEPGTYLSGRGGVRIGDDVLIKDDHPYVMLQLSRDELLIL